MNPWLGGWLGSGGGTGTAAGSGTNNTIPKFNSVGDLADSLLTDDGTNVTLASGQVLLPNGTSALPAIAFTNQTGTGFNYQATQLEASVSGTRRFFVSATDFAVFPSSAGGQLNLHNAAPLGFSAGGGSSDLILARAAAANLRLGTAAANPPVAQTLSVQNASGTDIAGANWTFDGSQGTGTGAGGSFIFRTAAAGLTGSTLNPLATLLTVGPANVTLASGADLLGTDNTNDLFAATARGQSAYLGTSLLVNTTAATALHADATTAIGTPTFASVTASGTGVLGLIRNGADTTATSLNFLKTRSATGSDADTAVASGDGAGLARAWAADGATYREITRIANDVDTFTAANDVSGQIGFWTRPDGAGGVLARRGGWGKTGAQMLGAAFEGGVTTSARVIKKVTGIADNTATDVFTVTVPNANHATGIKVSLVSSNGSTDAFESTRVASGFVVATRTTGANAVATAAAIDDAAIATVAAGATHTLAYGVSAIVGGAGASNTFTIQVTIDDSGNLGSNQIVAVAELINSEATGVTIS